MEDGGGWHLIVAEYSSHMRFLTFATLLSTLALVSCSPTTVNEEDLSSSSSNFYQLRWAFCPEVPMFLQSDMVDGCIHGRQYQFIEADSPDFTPRVVLYKDGIDTGQSSHVFYSLAIENQGCGSALYSGNQKFAVEREFSNQNPIIEIPQGNVSLVSLDANLRYACEAVELPS